MKCTYHPEVETILTCSKCMKPICPRCMVQTPVGARCPDCARISKIPTYHVPAVYYLRAAGAALGTAIAFGIAWGFAEIFVPFFSLSLIMAPAGGYVLAEAIGLAVNRKRSTGLAIIGGISVLISFAVSINPYFGGLNLSLLNAIYDLVALGLGIYLAVSRLR